MAPFRIVSADAHVLEPPHIWETWLPKQYHDKAPKLAKDVDGGDAWQFAGSPDPDPKGVVISCWPSAGDGISDDDDAFWAVAEDEQMPVCIHINLIGREARQRSRAAQGKQLYGSKDQQSKANAKAVGGLAGVFATVPN